MSAGQFDRIIQLQSATTTVDGYGVAQSTWAAYATAYAKLLQTSTQEFLRRDLGETSESIQSFRIRWVNGVTLAHQIVFEGAIYRIVDLKEVGRRIYLDIRCIAVAS